MHERGSPLAIVVAVDASGAGALDRGRLAIAGIAQCLVDGQFRRAHRERTNIPIRKAISRMTQITNPNKPNTQIRLVEGNYPNKRQAELGNELEGGNYPQILIPYDRREAISLRKAAEISDRSETTLRAWCEKYLIGRRIVGGPWQVSRVALEMLLG